MQPWQATVERPAESLVVAPYRRRLVGVVADFAEEGWPSMDLAADLLVQAIETHGGEEFRPVLLRPRMPNIARRAGRSRLALNADRYVGRYLAYPRWLAARRRRFDLFHVVDHSYAHLVLSLPADRTVVTCHDLDAFRSLTLPGDEPRPPWFRATMGRVLSGLRRAAHVVCDADVVRDELAARKLVRSSRTSTAPLPVHSDFSPRADRAADTDADKLLGPRKSIEILHVGSTSPRKRLDVLLRVFARVRQIHPSARLVRVGGPLTDDLRALADELGVRGAIDELPFVNRRVLAAVYRRAAVVLMPSEREGFGLPVVEAMACGTPVVASDLPVLREVGGEAALFRPVGDVEAWAQAVDGVLWDLRDARQRAGLRDAVLDRAAAFSLEEYATRVMAVYRKVLGMASD